MSSSPIAFGRSLVYTLGFAGFIFVTIFTRATDYWFKDQGRNEYPDGPEYWGFHTGPTYMPLVSGGAGLIVGILRCVLAYPREVPTFYDEVQSMHVDPMTALKTALLGLVTLSGGLTVGPEAPLGAVGGAMGQFYLDTLEPWLLGPEKLQRWAMKRELAVYAGMAAAFACIFPSPLFAVLLLVELGNGTWKQADLWEMVISTGVAAFAAWSVFVTLASNDATYLKPMPGKGAAGLAMGWNLRMMLYAVPMGILGGLVGLIGIVFVKVAETVFKRLNDKMLERLNPAISPHFITVLLPAIIGAVSGWINIYAPLTLGDGSEQLNVMIRRGDEIGAHVLIISGILKLFNLGMTLGSGFVGGLFFPLFYIGCTSGVLLNMAFPPSTVQKCFDQPSTHDWIIHHPHIHNGTDPFCINHDGDDGLNKYFAAMVMFAAVPAASVPMPFTLVLLCSFQMEFSAYQASPLFAAVLVSYLMVSGIGLLPDPPPKAETTALEDLHAGAHFETPPDSPGSPQHKAEPGEPYHRLESSGLVV